jgi:hypothetical protein
MFEGRQLADIGPFKVDQAGDGLRRREFRQSLDFLGCTAESGPLEQVSGEIVIPIRGTDRGEIILPGRRPGGLGCRYDGA